MEQYWIRWTSNNLYIYILLAKNTNKKSFSERLQELVYKYVGPEVEMAMGIDREAFETEGGVYRFFIENIEGIHLYSEIDNQLNEGGRITTVYFFYIIAIFILTHFPGRNSNNIHHCIADGRSPVLPGRKSQPG